MSSSDTEDRLAGQPSADRPIVLHWLAIAAFISLVLILIRILPIDGPSIFGDEYTYAAWVSAFFHNNPTPPPLTVKLGSWLYLHLYELVFVGSGSFLIKARVLNAIISAIGTTAFVATINIVETSRKSILAVAVGTGAIVALVGDYAAYFMPDAPYIALVCVWLLVVTLYTRAPKMWLAVIVGIVGGLATMTKAHGILMLPAVLAVFLIEGARGGQGWRRVSADCVFVVIAWFACTSLIGFFLGDGSFNPVGSLYSNLGMQTAEHISGFSISTTLQLAAHHFITVILIFGLPLLLCFWLALTALFRPHEQVYPPVLKYPALVLFLTFIGMLFVTVVFTASMAGSSPDQTLTRLYGRYYEHFAVFAACLGIVGSAKILTNWSWLVRLLVSVLFLTILGVAWWASFAVVGQYPIDYATAYGLYGLYTGRDCAVVLAGAGAVVAMLWPKRAPFALGCAMLIWMGIDIVAMESLRWSMIEPEAGRVSAMVARETSGALATVEIVGPGYTVPVLRAGFHLLNDRVHFALGADADKCAVDGRTPDWVVIVDGAHDPCGYTNAIQIGSASAARRTGASITVMSQTGDRRYHAVLGLADHPEVTRDGRHIVVTVNVTNMGSSVFGSAPVPHSVNLGAHSIDATGKIINNDLARGHLPWIAPGATQTASIVLPVAGTIGHRVELLPVEEGVSWFDAWGTAPLIVGPFSACRRQSTQSVCDAAGKLLPVATSTQ